MRDEYVYEEKKVGKYIVKVVQDSDPSNPRTEWDNMTHMICFHRRYNLGDKHDFSVEEIQEFIKGKDILWLPLYLYDHSGITMSTKPFSCPWDSGQVGIIYIDKAEFRKELGCKRVSKKKAYEIMESDVKVYDQYLTGEVYGFRVEDEDGDTVESCWGFFGESEDCLAEGISTAHDLIRYDIKEHLKKLKTWILNKVPLEHRTPLSI